MHWCAAAAVLACAAAFAPARTPKITAVVRRASKEQFYDDDDWRRLANSKDAAADVFLSWAAEDPGLGACLRTLNLRRGRFGGDVPPALWPVQLRRKLARGLGRRGRARSARRAAWAGANATSLELSWRDLRAAYAEREAVVRNVNGAAEDLAGSWVYHLGLLQAYAQNHDSARPPAAYVALCGARLGRWLGVGQRVTAGHDERCCCLAGAWCQFCQAVAATSSSEAGLWGCLALTRLSVKSSRESRGSWKPGGLAAAFDT